MNLLFLIDYINYGLGAERALLNIANSLCDKHNVVIAARFDGGNPSYWMDPRIDYRLLNTERDLPLNKKVFSYLKETQALKNLKKEIQEDVCISFLETANFLNVVSGGPGKTVISIRNYYSLGLKSDYAFIQRIKAVWSGKTADQVVCVSEMIRQDMVKHFKAPQKKTCVIYNMYNVQQEAVPYREDIYDLFIQRKGGSHAGRPVRAGESLCSLQLSRAGSGIGVGDGIRCRIIGDDRSRKGTVASIGADDNGSCDGRGRGLGPAGAKITGFGDGVFIRLAGITQIEGDGAEDRLTERGQSHRSGGSGHGGAAVRNNREGGSLTRRPGRSGESLGGFQLCRAGSFIGVGEGIRCRIIGDDGIRKRTVAFIGPDEDGGFDRRGW